MSFCSSSHLPTSATLRLPHYGNKLPPAPDADVLLVGLPLELWRLVFSYLPVADLCRSAQVCRSWDNLVASLDNTTWKTHFLHNHEWKHPDWPKSLENEPASWRLAYKQHAQCTRLWLRCAAGIDTTKCMGMIWPRYERRTIHVGPEGEYSTLKKALAAASPFDRIMLAPGLYDEQLEFVSKVPFELVGNGEPGSVVLLTCIEQAATTGRLCNVTLNAPWYTSYVIKVLSGHLQVDQCVLQEGQVLVQSPGTLHMRYCALHHTQVRCHAVHVSILENCWLSKADSCAIAVEGQAKLVQGAHYQDLLKAADTYNLQTHLPDETAEPDPSEDSSSLNDADTVLGSSTDLQNATNDCRTLDGYDSSSTDLSSSDEYSDSPTSPCNSQPWLGQASVAWAHHSKEPPLQWDTDPIPAFPRFLRTDVACRLALSHIQGLVVRRCKLSQCHGGISVGRRGQARVEQCDMMDLQYGVRCLQNTKVAILENTIHHCSSSAIFMRMGATGIIAGNDIYYTAEAGIDVRKQADPLIQHNRLHHSKRSGVVVLGSGRGTIKANDIYQNREAGIYILFKGDPYVSGNRICHGAASGIAVTENGRGYIVDNMISGNRWGGIDIRRGGTPHITRNLICNGWADGIVVGSHGKGTIEANCIRGNSGCGIWVMSGQPLIQSNQIYNNKDTGILLVTKEGEPDSVDSADEESDSDMGEYSTAAPAISDTSSAFSCPATCQINIKYNSVYRNSGCGVVCHISESVLLQANAIHANRGSGVAVRQAMPVLLQRNSVTCNAGHGVEVTPQARVQLLCSGVYDNLHHGVTCEGEAMIQHTDILCNQQSAIHATAQGNIQVESCRLYASQDPAILLDGSSHGDVSSCIIYTGEQEESVQCRAQASCVENDNTPSTSHLQRAWCGVSEDEEDEDGEEDAEVAEDDRLFTRPEVIYRRGFDWQLTDPPPRPPRELPPKVEILATPTRHLESVTRVGLPWGGQCHYSGSKTCVIL